MKNHRSAFTLVEVLASVLILSIGILSVFAVMQSSREYQTRAKNYAFARSYAVSKIQTLRATYFNDIVANTTSSTLSQLPSGNSCVIAVSRYPNNSEMDMYQVNVTITWLEGNGTRAISYDTLISKK